MTDTPPVPPAPAAPAEAPPGVYAYPWGPAQPAVEPTPGTSWQAIVSFVTGLVGLAPVGVVFGILALIRIGRNRQKGKVLAVLGIVLSGLWLAVGALVVVVALVLSQVTEGASPLTGGRTRIAAVPIGSCYDLGPNRTVSQGVTVLPCDRPHDRQLLGRAVLPAGGPYPGLDEVRRQALLACEQLVYADAVDPEGYVREEAQLTYVYPGQTVWAAGNAPVECELYAMVTGNRLTRDLRQDPAHYTTQQRAFLDAIRQTFALRMELESTPDVAWSQGRAIAAQLAAADRAEARALPGLSALNTAFLRQSGAALAQDDLTQAALADRLTRVTSQGDWTTAVLAVNRSEWDPDVNTIRITIGL